MMKIALRVDIQGMYGGWAACMDVPELFAKCFEPMRSGDVPLISGVVGEATGLEAKIIMKTREDSAEILAKKISGMLVSEMKKNDTHNGYKDVEA